MSELETTQDLIECPVCHKQITARFSLAVGPVEIVEGGKSAQMTARVTGCRITHNCIPQTRRGDHA